MFVKLEKFIKEIGRYVSKLLCKTTFQILGGKQKVSLSPQCYLKTKNASTCPYLRNTEYGALPSITAI